MAEEPTPEPAPLDPWSRLPAAAHALGLLALEGAGLGLGGALLALSADAIPYVTYTLRLGLFDARYILFSLDPGRCPRSARSRRPRCASAAWAWWP